MSKAKAILLLLFTLFFVEGTTAQYGEQYEDVMANIGDANYGTFDDGNPYATVDMLNHVRRERFYLILPQVMRERTIDICLLYTSPSPRD